MKQYETVEVYETELHGEIIVYNYGELNCKRYNNFKIQEIISEKNKEGYYVTGFCIDDVGLKHYIITKEI